MKKFMALILMLGLMLGMPIVAGTEEATAPMEEKTGWNFEHFGQDFFSYMGGVFMFPVQMGEKAVRTLLFMDHE